MLRISWQTATVKSGLGAAAGETYEQFKNCIIEIQLPADQRCGLSATGDFVKTMLANARKNGLSSVIPLLIGALALTSANLAHGKDGKTIEPTATSKDKKGAKAPEEDDFPPVVDEPGVRKQFSRAEVQRICQKYEGQLIAYYGDVYKVEHCRRRPVMDNKTVYTLQRDGHKVLDVDGDAVAALAEGEAVDEATSVLNARSCKQLEGHYVTFSNVDVYFIEHCHKRLFPDWTTYVKHRERREDKKGEILSLSWLEFDQMPEGRPLPSVIDDIFAKMLTGEAGIEIIPIDEACAGLDGQLASYYAHLYRIERCRRREIDEPEIFLKKIGGSNNVKIVELRSEQWLSLPEGRPISEKTTRSPEKPGEILKK